MSRIGVSEVKIEKDKLSLDVPSPYVQERHIDTMIAVPNLVQLDISTPDFDRLPYEDLENVSLYNRIFETSSNVCGPKLEQPWPCSSCSSYHTGPCREPSQPSSPSFPGFPDEYESQPSSSHHSNESTRIPINLELQEQLKLERKRQRNRIAAAKCRKKKLQKIQFYQNKVDFLKAESLNLEKLQDELESEVNYLKHKLFNHIKLGCSTYLPS